MKNKRGFTLAELLVVVAIIAILVAVSVPIFKNSLKKAKDATNRANIRVAKAECIAHHLNGFGGLSVPDKYVSNKSSKVSYYYYDPERDIVFWPGNKEVENEKYASFRYDAYLHVIDDGNCVNGIYQVIEVNIFESDDGEDELVITQPVWRDGKICISYGEPEYP